MLGGGRAPGNQELLISSFQPFFSHHTTGYHPHPGILQGGQQHPREGPGGLPKQADVFVQSQADSLPCHPNQNSALKYGHWKASTVLARGGYGSQHSTNCFCWLPAFQAKSNNHKKEKPLTFDKAFQFERGQEKVPGKGRETTFSKTL